MRKALVLAAACGVFGILIGRWTAPMPASADAPIANGDVNGDGRLDLADAVYIINNQFYGGPAPVPIELASASPAERSLTSRPLIFIVPSNS